MSEERVIRECNMSTNEKNIRRICKTFLAASLIVGGGYVVFALGANGWWLAPGIFLAFDL